MIPPQTDDSRWLRWRRNRRIATVAALVLCGALVIVSHHRSHGDDWAHWDHRQVTIAHAFSGDLLQIHGDETDTIRLLGIYIPSDPTDRARQSVAAMEGRTVFLRLDPIQTRDADGHLLAYVWLSDTDMLNADLVRDGLARADRRMNCSERVTISDAESEARRKKRGIWLKQAAR